MPTAGLSLVGFMEQQAAINHLKTLCVPKDYSDAALLAEWTAAQAKLGAAFADAGQPDIQDIPAAHQAYIATLVQIPWVVQALQQQIPGTTFKLVEIDPLLAFQFTVDKVRSDHHCHPFTKPPKIEELLNACLPQVQVPEATQELTQMHPGIGSAFIKAKSLNVRMLAQGIFKDPATPHQSFTGLIFGMALPFVQVVRFNGRCYLHNGFHRSVGARLAGATHIPCVLRDVPSEAAVGIRADGYTFSSQVLNGPNPPTIGHFTQGRAYDVNLRGYSRALHVSWAEWVTFEE
jgi:hypothetical protein